MASKDFGGSQIPSSPSAAAGIRAKLQGLGAASIPKSVETQEKAAFQEKQTGKTPLFRKQIAKMEKDTMLTIRTKAASKKCFDDIRKHFGYSQSDFFDLLLVLAEEEARRSGYQG